MVTTINASQQKTKAKHTLQLQSLRFIPIWSYSTFYMITVEWKHRKTYIPIHVHGLDIT